MNSSEGFSDPDIQILDIVLNFEPIDTTFLASFRSHEDIALPSETLNEILNKLSQRQLITVRKEQYQTIVKINDESRNVVRKILESHWEHNTINEMTLRTEAEKNLLGILKLLEFKYDDKPHIGFSDYFMDADSLGMCNKLARARLVFKQTWSSRKHYYESYYLRKFPFDIGKSLEQLIVEKINLKDLDVSSEWPMVVIGLYSDAPLLSDFRLNFPHLTSDEISEFIAKLEQRGIVSRIREEITISKGTRDIVKNYFFFNQYNQFKSVMLQQLRRRTSERPSNLFLLGLIRRILTSTPLPKTSEPFCSIKKDLLRNVSDDDLKEASKLGILYLTGKEVIVAHEIVTEIESVLKSALMMESFMTVSPHDNFRAMQAWVQTFGRCKDYVKIWDEYINEATLDIIERFCPRDVAITILSAIEKPREIDVDETENRIKTMRNSGRKINLFFVGRAQDGVAPFHKRYIFSENLCYLLTSSIKQVGKAKSVDIIGVLDSIRKSEVEPAFQYWIETPTKRLSEKGYERIEFEEWITRIRK